MLLWRRAGWAEKNMYILKLRSKFIGNVMGEGAGLGCLDGLIQRLNWSSFQCD